MVMTTIDTMTAMMTDDDPVDGTAVLHLVEIGEVVETIITITTIEDTDKNIEVHQDPRHPRLHQGEEDHPVMMMNIIEGVDIGHHDEAATTTTTTKTIHDRSVAIVVVEAHLLVGDDVDGGALTHRAEGRGDLTRHPEVTPEVVADEAADMKIPVENDDDTARHDLNLMTDRDPKSDLDEVVGRIITITTTIIINNTMTKSPERIHLQEEAMAKRMSMSTRT